MFRLLYSIYFNCSNLLVKFLTPKPKNAANPNIKEALIPGKNPSRSPDLIADKVQISKPKERVLIVTNSRLPIPNRKQIDTPVIIPASRLIWIPIITLNIRLIVMPVLINRYNL